MQRLLALLLTIGMLSACQNGGTARGGTAGRSGSIPYGKPVPGKPGLVYSPYTTNEVFIDVRGFERGTEVRDPWTDKIFLVP